MWRRLVDVTGMTLEKQLCPMGHVSSIRKRHVLVASNSILFTGRHIMAATHSTAPPAFARHLHRRRSDRLFRRRLPVARIQSDEAFVDLPIDVLT